VVSIYDFSFKNGSPISLANAARTLQWLIDFDWLLTLIYLAYQIPHFSPHNAPQCPR